MKIGDGRGKHRKAVKNENRANIMSFFDNNPGATIKACCDELSLSYRTVRAHIDAIRSGIGKNER